MKSFLKMIGFKYIIKEPAGLQVSFLFLAGFISKILIKNLININLLNCNVHML